jgi:hypothetical protein
VEHDGRCITVFSAPNYCDQVCHPPVSCCTVTDSSDYLRSPLSMCLDQSSRTASKLIGSPSGMSP